MATFLQRFLTLLRRIRPKEAKTQAKEMWPKNATKESKQIIITARKCVSSINREISVTKDIDK